MSTVCGQPDVSRALRCSGGYLKQHVVARCYAAGGQLGVSVIFLKLRRPFFESS